MKSKTPLITRVDMYYQHSQQKASESGEENPTAHFIRTTGRCARWPRRRTHSPTSNLDISKASPGCLCVRDQRWDQVPSFSHTGKTPTGLFPGKMHGRSHDWALFWFQLLKNRISILIIAICGWLISRISFWELHCWVKGKWSLHPTHSADCLWPLHTTILRDTAICF